MLYEKAFFLTYYYSSIYNMSTYCQYNDAFKNNDNDDLDQLARKFNNTRKKLHEDAKHGYDTQKNNACVGIDCLANSYGSSYSSNNILNNMSPYDSYSGGDFTSKMPTPIQQTIDEQEQYTDDNFSFSNSSSDQQNSLFDTQMSSYSSDDFGSIKMESDISSNYSSLPSKKKHIILSNNHLKQYNEKDDKNVIDHMKHCEQCQQQLIKLVKNNNNKSFDDVIDNGNVQQEKIFNISNTELKYIMILILIGVTIIMFFDFISRN
jgi:hypothetical protein